MTAPLELPEGLPELPALKTGYRWEYRGKGWRTDSPRYYAFFVEGKYEDWEVMTMATCPSGMPDTHYIERVIC